MKRKKVYLKEDIRDYVNSASCDNSSSINISRNNNKFGI